MDSIQGSQREALQRVHPYRGLARSQPETPERLQARDGNLLEVIRKGEALGFGEWVDSFLENYSKPPLRAQKTHEANMRCATHLKAASPGRKLVDITADAIEDYLRRRLGSVFGSSSLVVTEKRGSSNRPRCTRSFGFSGAC